MYGKIQELGFTEIIPLIRTSDMSGWCSVFSHPEFFQSSLLGLAAVLMAARWQTFFPFFYFLRAHQLIMLMAAIADNSEILCLLIRHQYSISQAQFSSVQSHSVLSNSLWSHDLQHARPLCLRLKTAYYNILKYWHRAWDWAADQ